MGKNEPTILNGIPHIASICAPGLRTSVFSIAEGEVSGAGRVVWAFSNAWFGPNVGQRCAAGTSCTTFGCPSSNNSRDDGNWPSSHRHCLCGWPHACRCGGQNRCCSIRCRYCDENGCRLVGCGYSS